MLHFAAESRLIFFGGVEQPRDQENISRVEHESISPDGGKKIRTERMQCLAAHTRTETYHAREEKQADQLLANITSCHSQEIDQKNSLTRADLIAAWKSISTAQKADLIADLTPVIGNVKGGVEALINRTLFSGEKPKWYERALGAIGALPVVGTPADIAKVLEKLGMVALSAKALRRTEIPVGMANVISDVERMLPSGVIGEVQKITKAFEARDLVKMKPYQRIEFIDNQIGNLEYIVQYLHKLDQRSGVRLEMTEPNLEKFGEKIRVETVRVIKKLEDTEITPDQLDRLNQVKKLIDRFK